MRFPLRSKRPAKQEILSSATWPAPVLGWNTRDSQANMAPSYALYMDNWWPTAKTVQIRKGAVDFATGFPPATPIKTLLTWNGVSSSKLFAATDTGLYDITTGGSVGAVSQALTNGRVEYVNFRTTGKSYLVCVNGTDNLVYYDGAAWASVANFTVSGGSTLNTNEITNIHSFKRGLYFLRKNSLSFYYLPIDQILGTVAEYPLGALFDQGGYIVAQGTWTVDGGKGVDDLTVFVTSEGQMAVYQGTDPSNSSTWSLVGVFNLARPLGPRCFCKFGGDLLYMSYLGCEGISKYLQSTKIDMSPAITNTIAEAFTDAASNYGDNLGWEFCVSPNENILLINIPTNQYSTSVQYVMNTNTGAWCRFTGWDTFCWTLFNNTLYGGMLGKVGKFWQAGGDFGNLIQCYVKQAPQYLNPRARQKQTRLLQPVLKIGGRIAVDAAIDNDFEESDSFGQAVFTSIANSRFDSAQFDSAVWGQIAQPKVDWITVADEMGYAKALRLRALASDATVEWSATNVLYEAGALQG
jgi:hypothetical protein